METSDFSLSFLDGLGEVFCDEDVERIWRDRVFPLVLTADFATNWKVVKDTSGVFFAPSGTRCRVEPQRNSAPLSSANSSVINLENIPYESIIFAKITY